MQYNRTKDVIESTKGLKQSWVAEQHGFTPRYFYKITYHHTQPSLDKLYQITKIPNVKVAELL